jgi:8-oxo-dGTP pyrophosphatase MutT (NUDIX family)
MTARELAARWGGHVPGPQGIHRRFAVLVPLVETAGGLELLFEVRSPRLRQPGEVCFPGGRAEDGETAEDCALRETFEELAIPPAEVTLLGKPDFLVHQRGFVLQPVIGLVSPAGLAAMTPSPAEVAEVFTAPAEFFRSTAPVLSHYTLEPQVPADFPFDAVGIAPDYPWGAGQVEVPVWRYGGHVIWGLTARILREVFREM